MSAFALVILFSVLLSGAFALQPTSEIFPKSQSRVGLSIKSKSLQGSHVVLAGNSTVLSANKTFELGFFSTGSVDDKENWYLGIWYASIPNPTYVWVANREDPIKNVSSASLEITEDGKLAVKEEDSGTIVWQTNNVEKGKYSLILRPPYYGEIALVYIDVDNSPYYYWSTGNWTGNAFAGVPEMTVPYIYNFHFDNPFTAMASFGYNEVSLETGLSPPLTRFYLDYEGLLQQFTWSPQTGYWNMFWSQPENVCKVYGLCGNFGFCNAKLFKPCKCFNGFRPVNQVSWDAGEFSGGCHREGRELCRKNDGFGDAGVVSYEGATVSSFTGGRSVCEKTCLGNCSCIGLHHNERSNLCKNLYGSLLNLKNQSSDSTIEETLYLRVPRSSTKQNTRTKLALIEAICGCLAILLVGLPIVLFLRRRRNRKRKEDEEGIFPVTNLRVFSYKELHAATRGFSEKLGHGGFGAVFQGELSDSTLVAVKRLEKPGEVLGGRRNVEGPPSAGGGVGGGTEKWFFPPWAASQIIEGRIAAVVDQRLANAKGEGSNNGSPSKKSSPSSPQKLVVLEMESPFLDGSTTSSSHEEAVVLHSAPSTVLVNGWEEGGDYPHVRSFEDVRNLWYIESGKLWSIAAPIAFNILCNYGINSFTNIFVGHIGDVELSAIAISLSVIANFSFGFLLGMSSALETLCGQAFGAGQVDMLGVYMQRSWIILTVACISLMPLYIYATPVLKLLGQRGDIADMAGRFSIQIIPQMFSLAINFSTQKFLQAQSKVGILAWVGFVALVLHIGVLFLFVSVFKWGTAGAAAAYDISGWIISLAQVVYILGWCKDAWKGFSWLAFKDIWSFVKLSVASAVMLCLEIWYFMSIIVLTGHLEDPVIAVGSLSICMNLNGWEGMLFIGINAAISVRVSNELGSGHPRAAKYSVFVTVFQSMVIGILSMFAIMATKNHFAVLFTNSEKMQKAVADLAYLLAATLVLNSIQPVISGVAVGGGWQGLVAYINLACYYVIGLPLGFLLGYKAKLGVQGIWMGMIFGTFLQTLILCYIVWKTNWNDEVAQASERMREWGGSNEERGLH
ncbi:OLC1v1039270C1 [Oldenlandia corymbosa var. corymbosa]|uniref:Protein DETOXIFICATION n=1 Tax=Oldenlandia corymbosa var. corymbosa TaxID=529605 RepID=A0AAV1D4N8_OLDCO|nr:OLC1v1039270C1 [Oldenlandia corymbosa var. corymbosa]